MKDNVQKFAEISDNINEMDKLRQQMERDNLWGHIFESLVPFDDLVEQEMEKIND